MVVEALLSTGGGLRWKDQLPIVNGLRTKPGLAVFKQFVQAAGAGVLGQSVRLGWVSTVIGLLVRVTRHSSSSHSMIPSSLFEKIGQCGNSQRAACDELHEVSCI